MRTVSLMDPCTTHRAGMVQYSTADGTVVAQFGNGGLGDFSDGVVRTLSRAFPTEVTLGGMAY